MADETPDTLESTPEIPAYTPGISLIEGETLADLPAPPTPDELAERAAEFDAELGGVSPPTPEPAPEKGAPSALEQIVAQQAQQIAALTALVQKSLSARPGEGLQGDPYADAVAASTEIKQLDDAITFTDSNTQSMKARQGTAVQELASAEYEEAVLVGQLKAASPEDRYELQQLKAAKSADVQRLRSELIDNDRLIRKNGLEVSKLHRDRAELATRVKGTVDNKKTQEQQFVVEVGAAQNDFSEAFERHSREYNLSPEVKADLRESFSARLSTYLRTLDPGAPGVYLPDAVAFLFNKHAELHKLTKRQASQAAGAQRAVQRAGISPPGTRLPAGSAPGRKPLTAEDVRARARFILSGGRPTT